MNGLSTLLDEYARWVRDKTVLTEINGRYVAITTPFVDRNNDYVQVYVGRDAQGYILTDCGETIEGLRLSGCDVDTERRSQILTSILNGFGVQRDGDALFVHATPEDFPSRKHNLVQAILAVDDLFYLARPVVASLFVEDVSAWLDSHDVRYTANIKLTGKSGYDHTFNFVIPASRKAPERLVRTVSRPSRSMVESITFAWIDVRESRPQKTTMYAIINDETTEPPAEMVVALERYGITSVLWSQRDKAVDQFVA